MLSSYVDAITGSALPFWAKRGFDRKRSLFHERLTTEGRPLAVPLRSMVQARQIYVYAHAATLGLYDEGLDQAVAAMEKLRALFSTEDATGISFAFSIDPETLDVHSAVRDSYGHAFVLLATAHLYAATRDPGLIALAEGITRYIDRRMHDAVHGGVVDAVPSSPAAPKRQNPQMHLLEAYAALAEAMPGQGYLQRALTLVALFRERMFSPQSGVLLEHFAVDWSPHPDEVRGALFEPGHHYEWVWLLEQVERLAGEPLANERRQLWEAASRAGHASGGLIYDEVSAAREVVTPSHRLWPHTEAIKAAATLHRAGDTEAPAFAERMAGLLLTHFVGKPFAGGWVDHVEPDLSAKVGYVPASSLYHLFLAAVEADAGFTNGNTGGQPAAVT